MGFPSAKNWFYCKSSHKFTVINTILIQERRRSSSRVQTIAYCLRKFSSIYIIVRMGNYQLSSFFKYLIIMTQRSKIIHFIDFSEKSEEIQIDPCSESQTHSQHYTDIKPTLDSGIWFGKSIREIENTLRPVNIYRPIYILLSNYFYPAIFCALFLLQTKTFLLLELASLKGTVIGHT